jgi:NTE family protein
MVTFVRLITLVRMRKFIITILLVVVGLGIRAQSVGVVFSGGGAKGLYHIGILKALEENNIPIDYVAGTSMG